MPTKLMILYALLSLTIEHTIASTNDNGCTPANWDGYWNSKILQCYFEKTDTQLETLDNFLRDQELEAIREATMDKCAKESEDFGGEMAKHFYWDCLSTKLQSEIDKSLAKASNNILAFKSVDWKAVNHCKVTYFSAAIETSVGSVLMEGEKGWTKLDFPKEVMNTTCAIESDDEGLIIYEGSKEWKSGKHFFYVSVFDDYLISIHSQPEVTSTHAQWTVTEFAELHTEPNNNGCFTSREIEICFSVGDK